MKILIGSCGGLTGLYLSRLIRTFQWLDAELFGFDISDKVPTKFFIDYHYILPPSNEEEHFIKALSELLNREDIDVYIPTHSFEGRVLSKYADDLRNIVRTRFVISPFKSFEALENKKNLYNNLDKLGIDTPRRFSKDHTNWSFPLFVKPIYGSGSKNTVVVRSINELDLYVERTDDVLILEYLTGTEYTVDTYFSKNGELIGYNQRIRLKNIGGAAVITENNYDVDVGEQIKTISKNFPILGPANFQFFFTNDGRIVFTDVNLRFASGGLPLTVRSGLNIPALLIKDLLNMRIDPSDFLLDKKRRVMYRYFCEMFEEL